MPSAKAAAAIKASLGRLYGPEVEVRYYNVGDPEVARAHAKLLAELELERTPLPAIFLDDELLFAGAINPLRVVGAVADARNRALTRER